MFLISYQISNITLKYHQEKKKIHKYYNIFYIKSKILFKATCICTQMISWASAYSDFIYFDNDF